MRSTPKLSQRSSGIWVARWRERGRQRQKSFGTTKKALAKVLFDEWLEKVEPGHTSGALDALDQFIAYLVEIEERSPESGRYYDEKLRPAFTLWDRIPFEDWNRPMLERYLTSCSHLGVSSKKKIVAAMKRFRDWAQDNRLMPDELDFVGRFRWPRLPKSRTKATLDPAQILSVLELARAHAYLETPIALSAFAALGSGDLLTLDWSEVDLRKKRIRRHAGRKKTGERLDVPMVPQLHEALLRAHLRQGRPKTGVVCAGIPKSRRSFDKARERLEERAGVPEAPKGQGGWHRYRRSCSTLLMRLGVPQPVRAAVLAHAPGSRMTDEYDMVAPADLDAAMKQLGEAFDQAREA